MRRWCLAALLPLAGCVQTIKQDRIDIALTNAGISPPVAQCMAHRMAQKLSIAQLHRLTILGNHQRTFLDYAAAVEQTHDPDALEVLVSSAALCKTGLIH